MEDLTTKYHILLNTVIYKAQTEYIDWEKYRGVRADPSYKPDYPQWLIDAMEMKKKLDIEYRKP